MRILTQALEQKPAAMSAASHRVDTWTMAGSTIKRDGYFSPTASQVSAVIQSHHSPLQGPRSTPLRNCGYTNWPLKREKYGYATENGR